MVELRGTAADIRTVAQSVNRTTESVGPQFTAAMQRVNEVADNLVGASAQLDKLVEGQPHRPALLHARRLPEFERFLREGRSAAREISELRAWPARGSLAAPLPDAAARRGDSAMRMFAQCASKLAGVAFLAMLAGGCGGLFHKDTLADQTYMLRAAPAPEAVPTAKGPSLRIGRTLVRAGPGCRSHPAGA